MFTITPLINSIFECLLWSPFELKYKDHWLQQLYRYPIGKSVLEGINLESLFDNFLRDIIPFSPYCQLNRINITIIVKMLLNRQQFNRRVTYPSSTNRIVLLAQPIRRKKRKITIRTASMPCSFSSVYYHFMALT